MDYFFSQNLTDELGRLSKDLKLDHVDGQRVLGFVSQGSTSRAVARIWALPKIWQKALKVMPHYCIETISEKFDKMSSDDKTKTLIHELLHIPKAFGGGLIPHRGKYHRVDRRTVEKYWQMLRESKHV